MAKRVGRELLNTRLLGQCFCHFGPGPDRDRGSTIAPGFREKNRATSATELPTFITAELSSTQNGSYSLTAALKAPSVLGTQITDTSKNGLYTVILKILSAQNTPVTSAAVILTPVSAKVHQQATTDTNGTVTFSNLKAGIYDATVEENSTKVGENIINISGANHILTLGINIKGEQKNPLLKSANPLLKTPLLIVGILVVGVIVGAVIAFLGSRLHRSKKLK